ncbi:MAG: 23S rRNA (pseudouridine(1915)-N(3))-methyltransferase RlmH [Candidatus Omnitrophica bacterium]|nr:23S rRNA (pseudouridine(1915)-N(3))-methyltransferase RlmH [Candidatus Omnitrophota bacterium]
MKLKIISIAKSPTTSFEDQEGEYLKRIRKYCPVDVINVKRSSIKSPVADKACRIDFEKALERADKGGFIVLLGERGRELSSPELARFLDERIRSGCNSLSFIIGGPLGIPEECYKKANAVISLSRLTFPHGVVKLILLEAIYRSLDILHGGRYHK